MIKTSTHKKSQQGIKNNIVITHKKSPSLLNQKNNY